MEVLTKAQNRSRKKAVQRNRVIPPAERAKKTTDGTLFLSCLMTYAQIEKLRAEKVMFTDLE